MICVFFSVEYIQISLGWFQLKTKQFLDYFAGAVDYNIILHRRVALTAKCAALRDSVGSF